MYPKVEIEGLTGKVKFDQLGRRTEFGLQIVKLKKRGLEKVSLIRGFFLVYACLYLFGSWHNHLGIEFSLNFTKMYSEIGNTINLIL